MISSSPPAHASTRETHLRRCSSHPPLRLRSCPPRQRKQVASEGLRGARVCPHLTSNSRAGDTQDGARSSKNLDGCTRASPRPSQFATAAQKRALPWSIAAQPEQQRCDCEPACPQTSDPGRGMCATSQVEDHACDAPPPPRSDSHPPLEGGQAPGGQPQSLANAGGFCGQSPLQAAETTCARNSGNGFSVRRARRCPSLVGGTIGTAGAARATLVACSAVGALELLAPQAEIPGIVGYIPYVWAL